MLSTSPQGLRTRLSRFLFQTLAFLVIFALLIDLLGRTVLNRITPVESFGINPSPMGMYFEVKWHLLQQYVKHNGGVDVILIGSSVVNTGLDPNIVANTYFNLTGKKLRIFNFGVEGLDIVPNSAYAKILVEKYHPALLIFGTIPRDYLANDNGEVNASFMASPWIEYQLGEFNFPGWVIASSSMLRLYLRYRNWMRADYLTQQVLDTYTTQMISSGGYETEIHVEMNLDQHPNPNDPNDVSTFAKYHNFQIDPGRLECLQDILNLQKGGGTRVIVINMPLEPTFDDYLGGQSVYQNYQQTIATTVSASGGWFISSTGYPPFPAGSFSDREHLDFQGAPILSAYLGSQLAAFTKTDSNLFSNSVFSDK